MKLENYLKHLAELRNSYLRPVAIILVPLCGDYSK
jgi:hypothetical protein